MRAIFRASVVTVALAGLALVGCNAPAGNDVAATDDTMTADETLAAGGVVRVFYCPGRKTFTAHRVSTKEVVVTLPDQAPVTLSATKAVSGGRFSDGTTTFWDKGDVVLVAVDNEMVLSGCQRRF